MSSDRLATTGDKLSNTGDRAIVLGDRVVDRYDKAVSYLPWIGAGLFSGGLLGAAGKYAYDKYRARQQANRVAVG